MLEYMYGEREGESARLVAAGVRRRESASALLLQFVRRPHPQRPFVRPRHPAAAAAPPPPPPITHTAGRQGLGQGEG